MKKAIAIGISLVLLTAGTALAVKPDNPGGGDKFDAEAAIQAEEDARIATDADLQNQINTNAQNITTNSNDINSNVLDITDNAAEIQANSDAINNLIPSFIYAYDGDHNKIGVLLNFNFSSTVSYYDYAVLSFLDYVFEVSATGKLSNRDILFSTTDCTGDAYVVEGGGVPFDNIGTVHYTQGFVFRGGDTDILYYIPKLSNKETVEINSKLGNLTCIDPNMQDRLGEKIAVYPNNPEVTGVTILNSPFQRPVTVGH